MAKKNAGKQNEKAKTRKGASKLRRTVMGTLSGIFLISALIVAAIPVKESEAEELLREEDIVASFTTAYDAHPEYNASTNQNGIPEYATETDPAKKVFYTDNGLFGVALVPRGNNMEGVLVYYDSGDGSDRGDVEIPQTISAFQYGNNGVLHAVYAKDINQYQFAQLSYISKEAVLDVSGNTIEEAQYTECTSANITEWSGKDLYDSVDHTPQIQLSIAVRWIGSTRYIPDIDLESGQNGGHYDTSEESKDKGIFSGAGINTLTIPDNILAIGNNAFKGANMKFVVINSSVLTSIGNHAFEQCDGLQSVTFENTAAELEIGSYAFANCHNLKSITIPDPVVQIGSGCFMNCENMTAANLYGSEEVNGYPKLEKLGDGVFMGCTALERIDLPHYLSNIDDVMYLFYGCKSLTHLGLPNNAGDGTRAVDHTSTWSGAHVFNHTNVTGCNNLYHVVALNQSLGFECGGCGSRYEDDVIYKAGKGDNCTFGINNLGAFYGGDPGTYKVDEKFYIEVSGHDYDRYQSYKYATEHGYAVKYSDSNNGTITYEKSYGNFYYCVQPTVENEENSIEGKLTTIGITPIDSSVSPAYVFIPDQIGPMEIIAIEQAFREFGRKDEIEYVHISKYVQTIGEEAFVGCEQLGQVEFADASHITKIADGAFKTNANSREVKLRFVGTISSGVSESEPYKYAMNPNNNYNSTNSAIAYISYTSEFPYNLEVELVVERDPYDSSKIISAVPTLVRIPTEDQLFSVSGNYSLSTYPAQRDEQNDIVRRTAKARNEGVDPRNMAQDEQQVYNAVYNIVLPEGIDAIKAAEKDENGEYRKDENGKEILGVFQGKKYLISAIFNSVIEVPDEAFAGCTKLENFAMYSSGAVGGEKLGDRVFEGDISLETVTLPKTLSEIGSIPFHDCRVLHSTGVSFSENPKFYCEEAIIYENKEDNTKKIVEVLYLRGDAVDCGARVVGPGEFTDVTELAPYAFQGCHNISSVDMRDANISIIPEYCFENCDRMTNAYVSANTRTIGKCAFQKTNLSGIEIPTGVTYIAETAFLETEEINEPHSHEHDIEGMVIDCVEGSSAYDYAVEHGFVIGKMPHTYLVTFYGYKGVELETQAVKEGQAAKAPEPPVVDGMVFIEWQGEDFSAVYKDLNIYAYYVPANSLSDNTIYHTVTFWNADRTQEISVQSVPHGGSATAPSVNPEKEGYTFTGWLPEFTNVTKDLNVYPQYREGVYNSDDPNGSGNGGSNNPNGGNGSGNGDGTGSGTDGGNGSGGNGSNGSGSGGSGSGGSGSTVSGNGTNRYNSSNRGNATVDVNKSGLSNTGLITATVNGSTDDFVVKITDSESARNAVEQALLNEYGSLENIRYFAMDISLYDRTGTTKIQNTDGITVTITMPIPDALRSYGGNNKAGAVVGNNTLQKLDAKFTTIDGVPCISFVATHFSPYTIYVDLNNLSASGMIDATPTTGDPIHPKWFLSIGLFLMSIMMFCMKGSKRTVVKVISG